MSPLAANLIAARLRYRSLVARDESDVLIETARCFEREAARSRAANCDVCLIAVCGLAEDVEPRHGLAG